MIAIGSDHGGFELKGHIIEHLKEKGIEVKDFGTYSEASVDYPDCAKPVCKAVLDGECECGILICGTGIRQSRQRHRMLRYRYRNINGGK